MGPRPTLLSCFNADYKFYTSGLEGSSLLEVFTFEKKLFSTSELVKCFTGENLGLVNMAGYSPGSRLYVSQCDAHCGSKSFVVYFLSAVCLVLHFKNRIVSPQLSYLYQSWTCLFSISMSRSVDLDFSPLF